MQAQMQLSSDRLVIYEYSCSQVVYWANGFPVFSSVPVTVNECVEHITLLCDFCRGGLKAPTLLYIVRL